MEAYVRKLVEREIARGQSHMDRIDQRRIEAIRQNPVLASEISAFTDRIGRMDAPGLRTLTDDELLSLRDMTVFRCFDLIARALGPGSDTL